MELVNEDFKRFNLRLYLKQLLEGAEKQGFSPETMMQLEYNAEQTLIESARENRRLLNLMRECGIK